MGATSDLTTSSALFHSGPGDGRGHCSAILAAYICDNSAILGARIWQQRHPWSTHLATAPSLQAETHFRAVPSSSSESGATCS